MQLTDTIVSVEDFFGDDLIGFDDDDDDEDQQEELDDEMLQELKDRFLRKEDAAVPPDKLFLHGDTQNGTSVRELKKRRSRESIRR